MSTQDRVDYLADRPAAWLGVFKEDAELANCVSGLVLANALDANPHAMRQRRQTVDPIGTIKARMGATHFLTKTLPKVAAEMALSVLAYNLTRVMNLVGTKSLMAAITA